MIEKRPFDVLNAAINNPVIVGMKGGYEIRGIMVAFDIHMNVVLEKAEQLSDGQVKRGLGTVFIRGDSIIYISPAFSV
ncbi:MAG: LSM domain-containing protein [Candidatus Anstonellaceae archaeon]